MARRLFVGASWSVLGLLALGPLLALVVLLLGGQHALAERRWRQHGLAHYQMDVEWYANGWVNTARLEVRHGQLVGGIDMTTGQPLRPSKIGVLRHVFPVERVFRQRRIATRWAPSWHEQLGQLIPQLGAAQGSCAPPLPHVRYHWYYGYPTELYVPKNPCYPSGETQITVTHLAPLP